MAADTLEVELRADDLESSARALLEFAGGEKIFLFHADMGAGKTTFIKSLCKVLGVADNMSSPTYSIVNEYRSSSGNPVYHFDLYRMKNLEECFDIGLEEYLDSGNYCLIEWPEIANPLYPDNYLNVNIRVLENRRLLSAVKSR